MSQFCFKYNHSILLNEAINMVTLKNDLENFKVVKLILELFRNDKSFSFSNYWKILTEFFFRNFKVISSKLILRALIWDTTDSVWKTTSDREMRSKLTPIENPLRKWFFHKNAHNS